MDSIFVFLFLLFDCELYFFLFFVIFFDLDFFLLKLYFFFFLGIDNFDEDGDLRERILFVEVIYECIFFVFVGKMDNIGKVILGKGRKKFD